MPFSKKTIYWVGGAVVAVWLYNRYQANALAGSGNGIGTGLLGSFGF